MKHSRKIELSGKGWSEEEIHHAEKTLERADLQDVHFSKIVFWSALLVIIFANIIISLIFIPFLVAFKSTILFAVIILMGGLIGFLYNFLITDIGHLEKKHHILAGILVPIIALVNMIVMVTIANNFILEIKANNPPHDPLIVSLVFLGAFILPFIIDRIRIHFFETKKAVIVKL